MKVRDIMTKQPVRINPAESTEVAARALAHYNIGALPVCGSDGKLCGLVTDRDLVIRCMASGKPPEKTTVREIMTSRVLYVQPDMDVSTAANLMGRKQVRRLPVLEDGKLCGMLSLGDIAKLEENADAAAGALTDISENISYGGV